MSSQKENGLVLEDKNGVIYLTLRLTIKRRMLWTFLILLILTLVLLGSSMSDEFRKIMVDFLISILQVMVFSTHHSDR